ncbi:MAG TPA: TIGR03086 family metal-binding protein [Mycobacterium sp.]|nr:TIGR03086 family metal-binding protein [Mycobacterium sp.]
MHTNVDLRPFHRTAVLASVDVVATVTRDDLGRPTPCAGWNLLDLLAHMTVQHHGFAAAARGGGDSPTIWASARVADAVAADPGGTYAGAAADVLDAFAADGVLDATFPLPEFGPGATFPGAMAIGFHFVDYVVHGWDVARSIGARFALPDDVVAAVLPLVFVVPDGEYRTTDGAPFGPAIAAPDGATDLDRILSHLGRSPDWKP